MSNVLIREAYEEELIIILLLLFNNHFIIVIIVIIIIIIIINCPWYFIPKGEEINQRDYNAL